MYTVNCTGLRGWSRLALAEDTYIHVYPGATSLLFFPRKENPQRAFFNSARKIRLKIDPDFVQIRQEKHHIFWFGRQISFCDRFQWPMTGSFEVKVSNISKRTIFPRCENLLQKNKLCGQIMSENYQVTCSTQFLLLKLLKAIVANHNRAAKFLRWLQPNR